MNSYKNDICYCGNRFIKFRVPIFNYNCYIHDNDYDYIITISELLEDDVIYELKLIADKEFLNNNIRVALIQNSNMSKIKYKILAYVGYAMVRLLTISYVKSDKNK